MKIAITNKSTLEAIDFVRDVAHSHPAWVHAQLGTESEAELQDCISQYSLHDYYDGQRQKRPDEYGVLLTAEDADWSYRLTDSGGASETAASLQEIASLAADWYETDQDADLDASSIEALQASIAMWEDRIAVANGHRGFSGHGSYCVSPSSEAGMNLRVERIIA